MEIGTIPAKSRHIIIKENKNSPHYLSIAKANDSYFYLNGHRQISMPGEFIIAGAESMYDRVGEMETIKIPRQIENSITIYVGIFIVALLKSAFYKILLGDPQ